MNGTIRPWIRPAVAAVLGLLPFVFFVGITNTVKVNGAVVRDEVLNVGGAVIAVIGLVVAARTALGRDHPPAPTQIRIACAVAALVCVVGVLVGIGVLPGSAR